MNSNRQIVELEEQDKLFFEINQKAFKELLTFVDFADDKLNIAFAEINFARDRDLLIGTLVQHPDCQNIQFEILNFPDPNLRFLRDELVQAVQRIEINPSKKLILLITGLEKSIGILDEYPDVLVNFNFVRDDLSKTVPHPIVFCLPEYALTRLAKYAPDLWSWGRKNFSFKAVKASLEKKINPAILFVSRITDLDKQTKQTRIEMLLHLLSEYKNDRHKSNTLINIYNELGIAYRTLGNYQNAKNYAQKSLKIARQINDKQGVIDTLIILGNLYDSIGEYEKAIDCYQQSSELSNETNNESAKSIALNNIGSTYIALSKYDRAVDYLYESVDIAQKINYKYGIINAMGSLGIIFYRKGEYDRAIHFYNESLRISLELNDFYSIASSLNNLANIYSDLRQYDKAIEYYQKSLEIAKKIDNYKLEAASLNNLGNNYYFIEEYQKTIDYCQRSKRIANQIGNRELEANSWMNLGAAWKQLEKRSDAQSAYTRAKKLFEEIGLDLYIGECDRAIQELENEN